MRYKAVLLCAIVGCGIFLLSAQQPGPSGIFTTAQADAGRVAYERTCGQCHTPSLMGRKGDPDERPPLSSLSPSYQQFIGPRGFVAPLAGEVFLDRWGAKTAGQLIARFQETVDDPYFKFENMTDETTVDITAYVLLVNGAKPGTQPLTRATEIVVNSATR
jgi:hypothetical protein